MEGEAMDTRVFPVVLAADKIHLFPQIRYVIVHFIIIKIEIAIIKYLYIHIYK